MLVMGPSGSGKSTLAREIGAALGLEVVHLDSLFWRPGWVEPPPEEFRAAVLEAVEKPAWVIDGNYTGNGASEERLAACDTIVFLDFPRRVCMWRVLRRTVRTFGRTRPDLADGCIERIDFEFLRFVWAAPGRRPKMLTLLDQYRDTRRVIVLSNTREVRRFVAGLRSPVPEAAARA